MTSATGVSRLLITGTTGFVGRNLKEHFEGRVAELFTPTRKDLNLLDGDAVLDYLQRHRFDAVIHCGVTLTSVEDNLKMYFNLERGSGLYGKMICVGSGAEYDLRHYVPNMSEAYFGAHVPADIYGFSKYVIAKDIEARHRNIYNLRVFGIFGPYEDYRRRFISNNICRVLSGLDILVMRNARLDYLYIKDFFEILEKVLHGAPKLRSYNVCAGRSPDLLSIARMIREVHGEDVAIVVREPGEKPEYSGDNSRVAQEFGWTASTDMPTAIAEMFDWYRRSSRLAFHPDLFK